MGSYQVTQPCTLRTTLLQQVLGLFFYRSKCKPGPPRNHTTRLLVKGFWNVLEGLAHSLKEPKCIWAEGPQMDTTMFLGREEAKPNASARVFTHLRGHISR